MNTPDMIANLPAPTPEWIDALMAVISTGDEAEDAECGIEPARWREWLAGADAYLEDEDGNIYDVFHSGRFWQVDAVSPYWAELQRDGTSVIHHAWLNESIRADFAPGSIMRSIGWRLA